MGYDEVITHLGDFGKYQRCIYFLLCLTSILCAFHKLAGVFLLAKPEFRCELPFENATTATFEAFPKTNWSLAYQRDDLTKKWQTCEYYDLNYTAAYLNGSEAESAGAPRESVTCERYLYDRSKRDNSAVTEWNMVCSRSFLTATSDSLFMLGVLLGSILFGQLSDKYGRKRIFFISLVLQMIFGVLAAFAPEYITYTLSRMVIGSTTSGVFLVAYVIGMEMVGPTKRMFAGIIIMMFFSFGYMLTAAFAYFIHDWRWLQISLTLPSILFISYYWIIPESARWLLSKGRKAEAILNIQKAAKFNKVSLPLDTLNDLLDDSCEQKPDTEKPVQEKASVFDLLRYPNLRRKTLLIFFDWFVNSGTYYGLSWNTNSLGDNVLLNFVISGAVEIPAYTFLLFTLNRWGRRTLLCGCMLTAGVALLATVAVPASANWMLIALAMFGKMAITASYGTVYIFSAEQYPTVVRNVGLGASSMVARIGGILAPFFNMLGDIWKPLPLIIFGAMAFVGGLLSLQLPETHNRPTLETIAEGESFGKRTRKDDPSQRQGKEMVETDRLESQPLNAPNGNGNGVHKY